MTKEQGKSIEQLRNWRAESIVAYCIYDTISVKEFNMSKDIVLNLIQTQQEEIEIQSDNYESLSADVSNIAKELGLKDDATIDEIYVAIRMLKSKRVNMFEQLQCLEKKDKIIDKMAEYLASIDFDQHCAEVPETCLGCPKEDDLDGYMQCIIQYFERKIEQ